MTQKCTQPPLIPSIVISAFSHFQRILNEYGIKHTKNELNNKSAKFYSMKMKKKKGKKERRNKIVATALRFNM